MDIHKLNSWIVLSASPRAGGNSDFAAGLLADEFRRQALPVEIIHLRDYHIAPCISCGACTCTPGVCPLDNRHGGQADHAGPLLEKLRQAAGIVITAPVYFYGLPAQFKALVDRAQRYWMCTDFTVEPSRRAYAVMPAGRQHGERLFDGSLLTLRPFLRVMGFSLAGHQALRGLDAADALRLDAARRDELSTWGRGLALGA